LVALTKVVEPKYFQEVVKDTQRGKPWLKKSKKKMKLGYFKTYAKQKAH